MDEKRTEAKESREGFTELKLLIPDNLYRAYQRCSWIITHETGRDQLEIMEELVHDFLVKHQC
ncbi:MAG: hypothetical protein DSY80_04375 [Desulfocapsa sp.]|nr:MAG: hypothetical protein DSY80_04375 [Desulfocapsa sp.]